MPAKNHVVILQDPLKYQFIYRLCGLQGKLIFNAPDFVLIRISYIRQALHTLSLQDGGSFVNKISGTAAPSQPSEGPPAACGE